MTAFDTAEEFTVTAHVTMVYQGPVAPHWELQTHFGDQKMLDAFWTRVYARLLLLPKHDPQFRRNRERVNRDAEREGIVCDWDLGEGDAETTKTDVVNPADVVVEDSITEDATAEDSFTEEVPAEGAASGLDEDAQSDDEVPGFDEEE